MADFDPEQDQSDNSYVLDAENPSEMVRLLDLHRIATKSMGGVFPERDRATMSTIFDVLDIGCGPGGLVHDVARLYPEIEVTGIDISKRMIAYARAHAQVQQLPNAHFRVMDALKPLDFPDASFDLVNARTIAGFVPRDGWPKLVAECKRLLRPGGTLRLSEGEWGFTNKYAHQMLISMAVKALHLAGKGLSPTGRNCDVIPMLPRLLRNAGFHDVQSRAHANDYSFGTEAHDAWYQEDKLTFQLMLPFLKSMKLATQEELDTLYDQAMKEMLADDFCAMAIRLTVWGTK
jgi:SAM-dependent methyltransferase